MTKTQLHLPPGSWPPCESRQTLRFHKKGPGRSRGLPYGADDENRRRATGTAPPESRLTLQFHKKSPGRSRGFSYGADDEIRTRDPHLGKVMLYQLSHVRRSNHPTNGGR